MCVCGGGGGGGGGKREKELETHLSSISVMSSRPFIDLQALLHGRAGILLQLVRILDDGSQLSVCG